MKNILDIVFNLGMLVSISILAGFVDIEKRFYKYKIVLLGVLFGTASLLGMLHPLVLSPGLIFDGRSVMLSICGFYFGPIATAIAAIMALTLRIYQGGPGALMGVSVIVTASMIGVGFHYFYQKKVQQVSVWVLYLMGILVHAVMVLLMFTLPEELIRSTLRSIALLVMIVYPLTTVFVGKILSEFNIHLQIKERQANILEGTNAGTWEWNVQTGETIFNERWAGFIGYTLKELAPISIKTQRKYTHPDDLKIYHQLLERHFSGELPYYECEYRMKHKDDHWIWVMDRGKVISRTEDGKPLWMYGTHQDITKRKQAEEKLKKTLDAAIETMSKIIEVKDPYTAGHQQRVSQLTTAIAKELNLSPDKVEGIRIASLIHDIGKISVPTEILSKTTTLSDIEFSLIKGHSQAGSDILKSIDFSYPIAQIVLQHHERLNGSGYPNNLKGDKILLEARIIGVADVVEAMSSHRPYRPALGIDAALEEISKNKGILYDPEVVDACLGLFKEKRFKFE